jgi:ATP-dependent DNA helicase RecG
MADDRATVMDADAMDALVSRLRAQGSDDAHVEVKSCGGGLGKSFWESVSAFANTTGGLFVLGLDENQGFTPARGFKDKQVIDQVVSGMTVGDGAKVEPSPLYEIDRARVDGASVVVVRVHQNQLDAKPCFVRAQGIKTGSYKRIDDKDLRLSAAEIYEMQTALVPGNSDRVAVDTATAQDLAPELVERLLSGMGSSRALRGTTSPEEKLQRLNVVTESGELSLAGLLTLGAYPQQFEPALIVDVTAHPGTVKSVAGPGPRFLDRELCEGTIPEIVAGAVDAVARNLRTVSVVEGVGRQDRLEIPREVLREAIANAVLHREYAQLFRGRPVSVDIYPDRVEVTSPGGLWGGKTVENIADGNSECRNPTLQRLLREVHAEGIGPVVEGQGSGVPLMINEMRANALPAPEFEAGPDQVKVIVRRHGVQETEERPQQDADQKAVDKHSNASHVLTPSEAEVAAVLSTETPQSIREIAEVTGRRLPGLRPVLRRLVDAGLAIATAPTSSRNRKYLAAERHS